jgi:hypothetical protein
LVSGLIIDHAFPHKDLSLLTLLFLCLLPLFLMLTVRRGKISRAVSSERQQMLAEVLPWWDPVALARLP